MDDISDKALRSQVVNIHKLLGVFILMLMVIRIFWYWVNPKPFHSLRVPIWQRWAERSVHFLLYVGLLVMPLSGWVGSVSAGKPPYLGNFNFELPLEQNKAVAHFAFDNVHIPLAVILIVLISIHFLAALYHHYIKKDDVLRRMWWP